MIERYNIVIIGSGAAAYSTADWLIRHGIDDIAIVSENRIGGTSRNAGSDKQTYYKVSFTESDSADEMCDALASGGGMHKDTAYIEAVNSAKCFFRLVDYGVPFPHDEYGRYIGYRTDHDLAERATSAGPLTSKYMTECLESNVLKSGAVTFTDHATVLKVVTSKNRAVGLVVLKDLGGDYRIYGIRANYIVLAIGGAACVYQNNVYPQSQSGGLALAADAGAVFQNLCEWQYGIASTKVKWNLSGSYQQVIPRYYSVDAEGKTREFLPKVFGSPKAANDAVFLKGYQWPFDAKKTEGSSLVDLAVAEEIRNGREVRIDFTVNPIGYDFEELSKEAKDYLSAADAVKKTPAERLRALNPKAIEFYADKGIDLTKEPLRIAVCAQHMNGGVEVDTDWQTRVNGLFAVGEIAGTFGVYRPGGSALNSTQVGGLRIAEYIARNESSSRGKERAASEASETERVIAAQIAEENAYIEACLDNRCGSMTDFSGEMSKYCAESRYYEKICDLHEKLLRQIEIKRYRIKEKNYREIRRLYKYRDALRSQELICLTLLKTVPKVGCRGGAICFQDGKTVEENTDMRNYAVITAENEVKFIPLREKPNPKCQFEKQWKEFNEMYRVAERKENG